MAKNLASLVDKETIEKILPKQEADRESLIQGTKFQVEINGALYPPKEVARYAARELGLDPEDYRLHGGESANKLLRNLGFRIIEKEDTDDGTMINYWIFQGNPSRYDFKSALQKQMLDDWSVSAHKDKIKPGDKIIIWLTGAQSGCYGLGEVTTEPLDSSHFNKDEFWTEEDKIDLKVGIEITHNLFDNPITKEAVNNTPELKDLKVGNQGTNFSATKEHFDVLMQMIEKRGSRKYWIYQPGKSAYKWNQFYQEGIMGLGWDIGNLILFTKEQIVSKLQEQESTEGSKKNDATANYEFAHVLNPNDYIIVKNGVSQLIGYGIVTSDYQYVEDRTDYKSIRRVKWIKKGTWEVPDQLPVKTLTDITKYPSTNEPGLTYPEWLIKLMNTTMKHENMIVTLNQILYGPPGTGKTYHTINRSLSIIEGKSEEELKKESRSEIMRRFDGLVKSGQIVFTTFHQSMSYEDFIEGLKPRMENGKIEYEIQDGVFKQLCLSTLNIKVGDKIGNNEVDSISAEGITITKPKGGKLFIARVILDELLQFINSGGTFDETGKIKTEEIDREKYPHLEPYLINGYVNLIPDLIEKYGSKERSDEPKILIIDEINRGNISAIFGELITLIEENKRQGNKEALEVTLPYSKTKFSVPNNVYIIGTMNTADRSVEALDVALRRRFTFEHMRPKPELLEKVEGIDLALLLGKINERIAYLKDEDHQIGHSYFMNIHDKEGLAHTFNKNIVPLLKEYFYNDFGKIRLVLGDRFVERIPEDKAPKMAVTDDEEGIITSHTYRIVPMTADQILPALAKTIA